MIGNDPRYQTIIDAYRRGKFDAPYQSMDYTPSPYYNPIYDIRREQIKAGELEEGARFPKPQLDTSPTKGKEEEKKKEEPFDPCPPGYQLIDGVCQPDTMFERGGGRDQEYTGPQISPEGLIEGYEQVLSPGMGAMNSMQMMELEKRFGPEKAKEIGLLNQKYRNRGVQYNPETGQFAAMSPTFSELMEDIGGGLGSMFSGIGDAAQQYVSGGGMLGSLISALTPQTPTVSYGGTSDISVSTQPMIPTDTAAPTGIVRPGYGLPTPQIDVVFQQKLQQQQELAAELEKQRQADLAAQQAAEAERLRQLDIQRKAEAAAQQAEKQQQQKSSSRDGSSYTQRAAPRKVSISAPAFSGMGYTRGR